jgi:crotonobetaine/carnitine-CoA ligase
MTITPASRPLSEVAAMEGLDSVRTIGEVLADTAARRPRETYLVATEGSFTFGETHRRANGTAHALHALGVQRGSRVAALLGNDAPFLFSWFGVARLGAALVPLDPGSTSREATGAILQARPSLLLFDEASEGLSREICDATGVARAPVGDVTAVTRDEAPETHVEPGDVVVLLSTSGTTGASKLVMQSHRSLVLAGEGFPWWLGLDENDRLLTSLPLFHLNALAYSTLGALVAGASLVVLPRFSARTFFDSARVHGATEFNAVGAMLEILMRTPSARTAAAGPLRLCYTTPAPSSKERHRAIEERFGFRVTAGYGLSETPYGTIWPLEGESPYGSMGSLKQHPTLGEVNEARIVDDDDRDVAEGTEGELLLRNPAVMNGYLGMPDETAHALRGGWLHTGDVVRRDPGGTFHFVARKKDIVRRRGENVAPGEIEDVLATHPGIVEASVIGVPSELGEEELKAFVVAAPGLEVSALAPWLRERLSRHKVPRYIEVVDDLPRTSTGRVARHRLPRGRTDRETTLD